MINAIIFDFAGVITSEGFWTWLKKVVPDLQTKKEAFMNLANIADRGEFSDKEYSKKLSDLSGRPVENIPQEILDLYSVDVKMVEFMHTLKGKVKLGLLSNFPSSWIRPLLKKFDLEKYFEAIIISSEVHMIKPEKEIFDYTCSKLGVAPQDALFIDDREINVVGARNAGMQGIIFTSLEVLQQELQKQGM